MKEVSGYVDRILYRNEDNGYTVLVVKGDGRETTCVGFFNYINLGEFIEIKGEEVFHSMYGKQIKVDSYEIKVSRDELSIRKYLGSGAIKGLGEKMAKKIVDEFGGETFDIIESEPERLAEIKGISLKKAKDIYFQVTEQRNMRDAMIYLQQFGISTNLSVKIYRFYGEKLFSVLKENPYKLAEDIEGVGFKTSDKIAGISGIEIDSRFRISSGIMYALYENSVNGNTCVPIDELEEMSKLILEVEFDIDDYISDLLIDGKIKVCNMDGCDFVYNMLFYNTEMAVANRLKNLFEQAEKYNIDGEKALKTVEKGLEIEFEEHQREAILKSVKRNKTRVKL